MKVKPVKMKELAIEKGFDREINGTLVFSNFGKKEIEDLSFNEFRNSDKMNYETNFSLTRIGNEDEPNDPFESEVCTKFAIGNVKIDDIPLVDVDLEYYLPESDRYKRKTSELFDIEYSNLKKELKKTLEPVELDRDSDSESFLEEFFNGKMSIIPSKSNKYEEDDPRYENKSFTLEIEGCSLISEEKDDKRDINDPKMLFGRTVMPEVSLTNNSHKPIKGNYELEKQLGEIYMGKRKKLPVKLFNKMKGSQFRGNHENKPLFIASLKDESIYQVDENEYKNEM